MNAVCEPEQLAFDRRRNRIFNRSRYVLVVNGLRDCLAQALRPRVESADDALQLGEFLHQLRRQVGLGQLYGLEKGGLIECGVAYPRFCRQRGRHGKILLSLPVVAPQFLLEGHVFEALDAIRKRRLLVKVPEEPRIFETRAQHASIAVANDRRAFVVDSGC